MAFFTVQLLTWRSSYSRDWNATTYPVNCGHQLITDRSVPWLLETEDKTTKKNPLVALPYWKNRRFSGVCFSRYSTAWKNCLLSSRALIKAILCFQSNLGTNTKKERCKFYNAWQCIQFWAEQRSLYAENLVGIKHVR